jgi:hypothetical protein
MYQSVFGDKTEQELFSSISANDYPCTFKLGSGIYDFTPFKLVVLSENSTAIPALMWNGTNPPYSWSDSYAWEFGWCQLLNTVTNNNNCSGSYYAAGTNASASPFECIPYSGSNQKSIKAALITGTNITYTVSSTNETIVSNMSGVSLTYGGGSPCPSTGNPTSFTINVYCNQSLAVGDTFYDFNATYGTVCDPQVTFVS